MLDDAVVDDILQSLRETIAWCVQRARSSDPKKSLRSKELAPPPRAVRLSGLTPEERLETMRSVRAKRAQLVSALPPVGDLRSGKLFGLNPDWQLDEGACATASEDFLDDSDHPPWDTWVAYCPDKKADYGDYLISWVPPMFLDLIPDAISVSSTDAVWWLASSGNDLAQALEARGLSF